MAKRKNNTTLKAKVLQEHLSETVSVAERVASPRASLPICADLLIASEGGRLKVVGTDLETAITVWCGAQIEKDGQATVPARAAKKLIGLMPDGPLELTATGTTKANKHTNLEIKSERRTVSLEGSDPENFPPLPTYGPELFTIDPDALSQALERSLFATAVDGRPVLVGVHVTSDGETLRLEATDGFRLSVCELPVQPVGRARTGKSLDTIVPTSALREVRRLLPRKAHEQRREVSVALYEHISGSKSLRFGIQTITMPFDVDTTLIGGTFPNIKDSQLVPEPTNVLMFDVEALTIELKAAATLAEVGTGIVRLYTDHESIKIVAQAEAMGTFEGQIDATGGTEDRVALNVRYVLDALSALRTRFGTIGLSGVTKPVLIQPVDDTEFLHIIMPMHVEWGS